MSERVDVWAVDVLSEAINEGYYERARVDSHTVGAWAREARAALAAVAELIEAIAAYHPRFLVPGAQPAYSEDGKRLQAAFAALSHTQPAERES